MFSISLFLGECFQMSQNKYQLLGMYQLLVDSGQILIGRHWFYSRPRYPLTFRSVLHQDWLKDCQLAMQPQYLCWNTACKRQRSGNGRGIKGREFSSTSSVFHLQGFDSTWMATNPTPQLIRPRHTGQNIRTIQGAKKIYEAILARKLTASFLVLRFAHKALMNNLLWPSTSQR